MEHTINLFVAKKGMVTKITSEKPLTEIISMSFKCIKLPMEWS